MLIHDPATLPLITLAGLGVGWLLVRLYNHLPESWLQDYGFRPNDPDWPPARRIRTPVGTAAVMAMTGAGFLASFLAGGLSVRSLLTALACCVLVLTAVPDALNKIIPDQSVIALALLGAGFAAADLFAGRGIRETAIDRIGGALAAGAVLYLVGAVSTFLLKKESMGMGDVKLFFACGLLTGLRMVPLLYFATFVSAAAIAVPMLLRRRREPPEDSGPPDRDVGGQAATEEEEEEDGADAPDKDEGTDARQAPLGPFIAAGCFLCLTAGEAVSDLVFSGFL